MKHPPIQRLRILFVSPHHQSSYAGGQETYVHELALALSQDGHSVGYLCSSTHAQHLPYTLVNRSAFRIFGYIVPGWTWLSFIHQFRPDIVHLTSTTPPFILLGFVIKQFFRLKVALMLLAPSHPRNRLKSVILALTNHLIGYCTHGISTINPQVTKTLSDNYPHLIVSTIVPSLPQYLSNTSTRQHSSPYDSHYLNILVVATLDQHHYYKGIDILLTAISDLRPDRHVHVVGGGNLLDDYRRSVETSRLQNRLSFLGYIPPSQLPNYYQSADALILPSVSDSEGFGLVLIEALSQGTPVITTSIVGVAPMLESRPFAKIIPPNQAQALISALNQVVRKTKPDKSAIAFARSFSPTKTVSHATALYYRLISG